MKRSEPFIKYHDYIGSITKDTNATLLWGLIEFTEDKSILTNTYIQARLNLNSKNTIIRAKKKLVEHGLLKIIAKGGGNGRANEMEIIYPKFWGFKSKREKTPKVQKMNCKNKAVKGSKNEPFSRNKGFKFCTVKGSKNEPFSRVLTLYMRKVKKEHFTNSFDKEIQGEAVAFSSEAKTQVLAPNETLAQLPTLKNSFDKMICNKYAVMIASLYKLQNNKACVGFCETFLRELGLKNDKDGYKIAKLVNTIKIQYKAFGYTEAQFTEALAKVDAYLNRLKSPQAYKSYLISWNKTFNLAFEECQTGEECYRDSYQRYPVFAEESGYEYKNGVLTCEDYEGYPLTVKEKQENEILKYLIAKEVKGKLKHTA